MSSVGPGGRTVDAPVARTPPPHPRTKDDRVTASTTAPPEAHLSARDRKVIITLLIATFVVILNETIMNVALPRVMLDLNVSARTGQWLSTAFMLTLAVVI